MSAGRTSDGRSEERAEPGGGHGRTSDGRSEERAEPAATHRPSGPVAEPARGFRRWFRLGGEHDPTPEHVGPKGMDRGRRIGIVLAATLYRMRVRGMANVPADGALLVVVNHQNFLDGALAFGELTRRSSFLIKAEAVKGPLGWLLTNVGQYALTRGVPDREPLMKALAQLKAGGVVGIFPEGTRGDGNVDTAFPGAGWLAARSGARVLPVAIRGTARPVGARRRFKPRVDMLVGEPFTVPQGAGRAAVAAATEEVRTRLAALVRTLDEQLARDARPGAPRELPGPSTGRKQER